MTDIILDFFQLREIVKEKLLPFGFLPGHEEYTPDIFGSRLAEFQSGSQMIQLLYDGRNHSFALQHCANIHKYPFQDWTVINYQSLDESVTDAVLLENMKNELESFLNEQ